MVFKRIILVVLDGVGVGALPDAGEYGDQDAATLQHVAESVGGLSLPHLEALGLGHIVPLKGVAKVVAPTGCWGKMAERSPGKDSVTGHWELTGVVLDYPFSVFPQGFPEEIIATIRNATGVDPLGNIAASGTDILGDLGEEHLRTGRPIIYTSSDSVLQIAAHEDIITPENLYSLCRKIKKVLFPYNICRVIARPFKGAGAADFYRTAGRRDFPRKPVEKTLLDLLQQQGIVTCGIGKIKDLFAGKGLTFSHKTTSNLEGMKQTLQVLNGMSQGLIMTNLVDFDMMYGHRLDAAGFATALQQFDSWLPQLLQQIDSEDLLIITADHGCDPTTSGTDHSREYVPLLGFSPAIAIPTELGTRDSFADVGATVADNFRITLTHGKSFLSELNTQR